MSTPEIVYYSMVAVGLIIPFISILISGLDGLSGDIDFDIDLDGDGVFSLIPINFNCLLFSLIVCGSVGLLATNFLGTLLGAIIAGIFAIIGYFAIYKFIIKPLKKSQIGELSEDDIVGKLATVITTIHPDKSGEIKFTDKTDSVITYVANYDYTENEEKCPISIGTEVVILSIDNNEVLVTRFNKN